jgi:prepilin-type processing-associated H-X9-DG protein
MSINGNQWTRIMVARHFMAINVGFLDGHATTVSLPDLWNLKWSGTWDLTSPISGPSGYPPSGSMQHMGSQVSNLPTWRNTILSEYKG